MLEFGEETGLCRSTAKGRSENSSRRWRRVKGKSKWQHTPTERQKLKGKGSLLLSPNIIERDHTDSLSAVRFFDATNNEPKEKKKEKEEYCLSCTDVSLI